MAVNRKCVESYRNGAANCEERVEGRALGQSWSFEQGRYTTRARQNELLLTSVDHKHEGCIFKVDAK